MNKKISTVRRGTIIFLSLLTVLVISLLIYGYDSMHDPEKVKARLYACGKFGDRHMLIDKQYLLFGRVTYQGVNHWGKNIETPCSVKAPDTPLPHESALSRVPALKKRAKYLQFPSAIR